MTVAFAECYAECYQILPHDPIQPLVGVGQLSGIVIADACIGYFILSDVFIMDCRDWRFHIKFYEEKERFI